MGFLRLLFAISIALAHEYPLISIKIVNRDLALVSFFIISGFYMSLILHEKYIGKDGSYKLFLTNRVLRIYPIYWVILIITLAFSLLKFVFHIGTDNEVSRFLFYTSSLPLFERILTGVNLLFRNITLLITADYVTNPDRNPGYFLILPAWSLQLEMFFYVLVPFFVKIPFRIFLCVGLLFIILCQTILISISSPLLLFNTFFVYCGYFFLGIIAYQIYRKVKHIQFSQSLLFILFLSMITLFLFYNQSHDNVGNMIYILFCSLFALSIPFLFLLTKNWKIDAFFGKFSYPVFVSHMLIFKTLSNINIFSSNTILFSSCYIIGTFLLSYLLIRFVDNPINTYRQHRL